MKSILLSAKEPNPCSQKEASKQRWKNSDEIIPFQQLSVSQYPMSRFQLINGTNFQSVVV